MFLCNLFLSTSCEFYRNIHVQSFATGNSCHTNQEIHSHVHKHKYIVTRHTS